MMNRPVALIASCLLIVASLSASDVQVPRPAEKLVYNIPGKPSQQLSQYLGKVVALEFIFTTCPHCKAASHVMSKMQTDYGDKGFQVLDLAVNQNADLLVELFAKEQQTTFPVGWVNQNEMTSFMGFADGRYVVPQLVLIDRKGMIRFQTPAIEDGNYDKMVLEPNIRKHVEELLRGSENLHAKMTRTAGSLR